MPLNLLNLDPVLPYVAMMLPKFQVTPFLEDEFLFLGFSFILDAEEQPNFTRMTEAYGKVVLDMIEGTAKEFFD